MFSNLATVSWFVRPGDWRPGRTAAASDDPTVAHGQAAVEAFLRYTPLLWVLGLLAPLSAALLGSLAWRRWPRGTVINLVVGLWCAVGVAQALAAFVNAWLLGDPVLGTLRHILSFGVLGWFFIGCGIAAGYAYELTGPRVVRTAAMLGLYVLILTTLALSLSWMGVQALTFTSPVGLLLPSSPSTSFYFGVTFFSQDDSLGETATRLALFFPWATALSMGSIGITLISLHEKAWLWRCAGLAGGTLGVIFSWSRIGIAAFVLVMAIEGFLWFDRVARSLIATAILFVLVGLLLTGLDPVGSIGQMRQSVDGARSGSSQARALIYEKSWEGFLRSPIVGYGWIGESVHPTENLPIGSHSTIYGLAYTGGVMTLGAFLLALIATLLATARASLTPDTRASGQTAFLLTLTMLAFCPYEELFSFSLPCLLMFTWIGGALRRAT